MDLYAAIESLLSADQDEGSLHADLGGRIRRGQLDLDERLPAMRYAIVADTVDARLSTDRDDYQVQFDVYGDRGENIGPMVAKLRAIIDRKVVTSGGRSWRVQCLTPGSVVNEPDIDRMMATYRFTEMT